MVEAENPTETTPLLQANSINGETVGNSPGSNCCCQCHSEGEGNERGDHEEKKVSTLGTAICLLKANVGVGILALPKAISYIGLLPGIIGIAVFGVLYVYCTNLLFRVRKGIALKIKQKRDSQRSSSNDGKINEEQEMDEILKTLDLPTIVDLSFQYGYDELKCLKKPSMLCAKLLPMVAHIGCCCVCFLFIAETLNEIQTENNNITSQSPWILLACALPSVISICFIRDGYELTGVLTMAFFLQMGGIAIMMYIFLIGEQSTEAYFAPNPPSWPLYLGAVLYAFEGTEVTLHLESHMKNRKAFRESTGVFPKCMIFLIFLYISFGMLGYRKFGNDVRASVTSNLHDDGIDIIIQVMTCLGVMLTYVFHAAFVFSELKKHVFNTDGLGENYKESLDLIIRVIFVTITFLVSALNPHLEYLLSLVGATSGCFLILLLPTVMSINTIKTGLIINLTCCEAIWQGFIMVLGVCGTVLCAYLIYMHYNELKAH